MAEDPVLDIQITLCITTDTTVIMDMILIMVLTIIGVMILSFIVAGTHRYFLVSVTVTGGTIVITDGTIIIIITATMITDIHTIPVSYTHFRAHETVLDIVCRLLLE